MQNKNSRSFFRRLIDNISNFLNRTVCCHSIILFDNDIKQIKRLLEIMSTKQEDIDVKVSELNSAVATLVEAVSDMKTAIELETAQIQEFIDNLPADVDTSGLDSAVANLKEAVSSIANLDDEVGGIFTPEEPVVEPEPAPEEPVVEPEPEVPVE